jgi:hypothetical protein
MQATYIFRPVLGTLGLLLIPFIAMQLTREVNWTLSDFVSMGVMLCTTGFLLELAVRKAGKYRLIAVATIIVLFLWLWVELAVGLFTNWGS